MNTIALARTTLAAISLALATAATHAGPVLDRVKAAQSVRVCIWPDYYGVTFRNPRTQQLGGIDVDLSAEFGRDLKAKIEYVETSFPKLAYFTELTLVTRLLLIWLDVASHTYLGFINVELGCLSKVALKVRRQYILINEFAVLLVAARVIHS